MPYDLQHVSPVLEYSSRAEPQGLLNNLVLSQTPATEAPDAVFCKAKRIVITLPSLAS
jgi:hypothetical protein